MHERQGNGAGCAIRFGFCGLCRKHVRHNVMAAVCDAVQAVVCRAYAIRPYNFRKTIIACPFPNAPKTTFDAGKTT